MSTFSEDDLKRAGLIICKSCGKVCGRTGPVQKYCEPCSEQRDLERKRLWAKEHPQKYTPERAERLCRRQKAAKVERRKAGLIANRDTVKSISWSADAPPELLWIVRVSVPFSYAASKNHIYASTKHGHRYLRKESTAIRDEITLSLKRVIGDQRVAHNKVWLDILVQKPNHKGDGVNVVDLVCDAVKRAIPVDDRWYSIRRLDWQIVKENPRLFVGVGQDTDVDCQICSYCGIIKPLGEFRKRAHNYLGVSRECKECLVLGAQLGKTTA